MGVKKCPLNGDFPYLPNLADLFEQICSMGNFSHLSRPSLKDFSMDQF